MNLFMQLLADEMLDAYDSAATRDIIKGALTAVLAELCGGVDEVSGGLEQYIEGSLKPNIEKTLMSAAKLSPAVDALIKTFEERRGGESEVGELLSLISGIIACAIPGALKECCTGRDDLDEAAFRATLMGYVEDSIKSILEEDGTASSGAAAGDVKELFQLAKDLKSDSNKSFFSKVSEVAEGRCNGKFMDTLLSNLSPTGKVRGGMNTEDILAKMINIMGSRVTLQGGFRDMVENNTEFMEEVLKHLAREKDGNKGGNAVDMLHSAVVRAVEAGCDRELDSLIKKLEGNSSSIDDEDVKSMLKQAIGLAKYMGRGHVVDALKAVLDDPTALHAIRDDSMTMDVLRKILTMRKMARGDERKRLKLALLEDYNGNDDEDNGIGDLVDLTDALTRCPRKSKLKKSKSMVKKSKSVIMTAKDIPMNAFMAMKSGASEKVACVEFPAKKDSPGKTCLNVSGREVAAGLPLGVRRRGDPVGVLQGADHHEGRLPGDHPAGGVQGHHPGRVQLHPDRRQRRGVLPLGRGQAEEGEGRRSQGYRNSSRRG